MKDCSWLRRAELLRLGLRLFLGSSHCWSLNIYCGKHAGQDLTCLYHVYTDCLHQVYIIDMFTIVYVWFENLFDTYKTLRKKLPTHPVLLGFARSSPPSGDSRRCAEGAHPLRHLSHCVSHGALKDQRSKHLEEAQIAATNMRTTWDTPVIWILFIIIWYYLYIMYIYSGQTDRTGMTTMIYGSCHIHPYPSDIWLNTR